MVNYNLLYRLQRAKKTPRRELAARAKSEKGPSLGVCSSCKEQKRPLADSLQLVQRAKKTPRREFAARETIKKDPRREFAHRATAKKTPFSSLAARANPKNAPFRPLARLANLNPATLTRVCNTYQEELHRMSTTC